MHRSQLLHVPDALDTTHTPLDKYKKIPIARRQVGSATSWHAVAWLDTIREQILQTRMGMLPTRNDLPLATRQSMVEMLNQTLADLIDLNIQCKTAHWNVKGLQFAQLHELFEAIAGEAADLGDEVAERAVALGGIAEGSLAVVRGRTRLPSYNDANLEGASCLAAIASALATLVSHARKDIDMSAELGDAVTADLYTGLVRALDKRLWFVEAHLQQPEGSEG